MMTKYILMIAMNHTMPAIRDNIAIIIFNYLRHRIVDNMFLNLAFKKFHPLEVVSRCRGEVGEKYS